MAPRPISNSYECARSSALTLRFFIAAGRSSECRSLLSSADHWRLLLRCLAAALHAPPGIAPITCICCHLLRAIFTVVIGCTRSLLRRSWWSWQAVAEMLLLLTAATRAMNRTETSCSLLVGFQRPDHKRIYHTDTHTLARAHTQRLSTKAQLIAKPSEARIRHFIQGYERGGCCAVAIDRGCDSRGCCGA